MESANNSTVDYQPAAQYHDELMQIYAWPFALVVCYTCIGTLGNIVVLYVYTCRWKRTKGRIFLVMLAALNLVNSAFNMPMEAYILWHPLQFDNHWLCKTTRGVTFVINNVCACVFVAIAIDRILLVYKPLKRQVLTCRYAKIACLISFVVGFVTSWPGFVLYGTATLPEKLDDVVVIGKTCYLADEFLQKEQWASIFNTILFVLMLTIFIILIILYVIIGRKLYRVSNPVIRHRKIKSKRLSSNKAILKSVQTLVVKAIMPDQRLHKNDNEVYGKYRKSTPDIVANPSSIGLGYRQDSANYHARYNHPYDHNDNYHELSKTDDVHKLCVTEDKCEESVIESQKELDDTFKVVEDGYCEIDRELDNVETDDAVVFDDSYNGVKSNFYELHDNHRKPESVVLEQEREQEQILNDLDCGEINGDIHIEEKSTTDTNINKTKVTQGNTTDKNSIRSGSDVNENDTQVADKAQYKQTTTVISKQNMKSAHRRMPLPRMSRRVSNLTGDAARDNTITMLMITVAYVLCFLPYLVIVSLRYANESLPYHLPKTNRIVYHVFLRTYFLNSVINPLIYSFVNKTFREIVVGLVKNLIMKITDFRKPSDV